MVLRTGPAAGPDGFADLLWGRAFVFAFGGGLVAVFKTVLAIGPHHRLYSQFAKWWLFSQSIYYQLFASAFGLFMCRDTLVSAPTEGTEKKKLAVLAGAGLSDDSTAVY